MKKLLKFTFVALAIGALAFACQPTVNPDHGKESGDEPGGESTEYAGPEQGSSDWSLIGQVLGTSWDTDYVAAENGSIYVVKNVKLTATDEFKFRFQKDWTVNRGGTFEALGEGFFVENNGANIVPGLEGLYDIYYNAEVEQMAVCETGKQPTWQDPPKVKIDGDLSDWAEIEGVTEGNHTLKVQSDAKYIYFCSTRTTEGRFSALWGEGVGYVYFAMDLDGDETTGVSLNSNGPYELIGFIYCFGGTAENPKVEITAEGGCEPQAACTLMNVKVAGFVDEGGVHFEYSIPRSDIIEIPNKEITVYSWGNKDCSKVTMKATL